VKEKEKNHTVFTKSTGFCCQKWLLMVGSLLDNFHDFTGKKKKEREEKNKKERNAGKEKEKKRIGIIIESKKVIENPN